MAFNCTISEQKDYFRPYANRLITLFPLFASLSHHAQNSLREKLIERKLQDGDTLYLKDEPENSIILVAAGHVHLSLLGPDGHELIVDRVGPGQLLGETALIDPQNRATSAFCVGNTCIWLLTRHHFHLLSNEPAVMATIRQLYFQRCRNILSLLESVALYRLESRLARHLLHQLEQSGACITDGVVVPIPDNQSHLATMINVSRPKLNAQLQQWRRSGLIEFGSDGLGILDVERLKICARSDG
ncbi:MAG: hypothetical protein RL748_306 [Pseudomonadota bacterium]|jgi:CRP-like cAMP-binding protein